VPHRSPQKQQKRQRRFSKLWTTAGFVGLIVFSGLGFFAYRWLTWLPPDPDCQNLPMLASNSDQLYCAQEAAQEGDIEHILAGVDLVADWGPGHPMYKKSEETLTEWSAAILDYAEQSLRDDGLEPTVDLVARIPPHSTLYDDAQQRIASWTQQWAEAETVYQDGLAAIAQQDWDRAAAQVTALRRVVHPYWRDDRAAELSQKISSERQARAQVDGAIALAASGQLSDLSTAVSMVQSVEPDTDAWNDAQGLIADWGNVLISAALEAFASGNVDQALAYVQFLPVTIANEGEAHHLLLLSQAKRLASFEQIPWRVEPTESLQLSEAIATAQQIPTESPLYATAQGAIAQWQLELENVTHLQAAQWIARLGDRHALELAIHQAERVTIDQPRRLQAQTLIAQWTQDVNNIRYRPQLARARQMAASGTVQGLQSAIAHVQSVGVDTTHWPDSGEWMSQWTLQLEAEEDRPILIAARELAAEGKWEEAIERANEIGAERSLHSIAQASIDEWEVEYRIEQNTAYLAQARELASDIRLTQAIARASLIERGQPLYEEAQRLISQWVAQREEILASRTLSESSDDEFNQGSLENSYEGYYDSRYYDYRR
jgi:hypothetical protein